MNNFFSVDRIEDDFAIIESPDKSFFTVSLSVLPKGVKEGSVLTKSSDGTFQINKEEENNRKKTNFNILNSIFEEK